MENTTEGEKPFTSNNLQIVLKAMQRNFPDKQAFHAFLSTPTYRRIVFNAVNRSLSPRQARASLLRFNLILDLIKHTPIWEHASIQDLPDSVKEHWTYVYYDLLDQDPTLLNYVFPLKGQ